MDAQTGVDGELRDALAQMAGAIATLIQMVAGLVDRFEAFEQRLGPTADRAPAAEPDPIDEVLANLHSSLSREELARLEARLALESAPDPAQQNALESAARQRAAETPPHVRRQVGPSGAIGGTVGAWGPGQRVRAGMVK